MQNRRCGARVAHFSRNANNGAATGALYWNLNNDSGNRNRNIASQLAVLVSQHNAPATSRGEYVNPILLGSYGEQQGEHQR